MHAEIICELFDFDEMPLMVCGQQRLNFEDLKNSTVYRSGFSKDHPTIKWFWEIVLEEWDAE